MCDAAGSAAAGCVHFFLSFFCWNNVCFHFVCENFSSLLALSLWMFSRIIVVVKSLRSFELSVRPTCVPLYIHVHVYYIFAPVNRHQNKNMSIQ